MKATNQATAQVVTGTTQREARRSKFIALRGTPIPIPEVRAVTPNPPADCTDAAAPDSVTKRRGLKKGVHNVTMSEIVLGSGSYGTVYMGINERTGEMLAVKQMVVAKGHSDADLKRKELIREVTLMKALDHPNIVRYVHAQRKEHAVMIYMEYMPGGNLSSVIKQFKTLSEALVKVYMRQALKGVEYLHQRNIVHRDIKAENILLNADGVVKLSDFGTSRESNEGKNLFTCAGTPWFMAPEVIHAKGHGTPADIWSLGCTMIQMLTGHAPFHEDVGPCVIFKIGTTPEEVLKFIPASASDEAKAVITWCLQVDPAARPTAKELLAHPFFTEEETDSEATSAATSAVCSANPTPNTTPPTPTTRPPQPQPQPQPQRPVGNPHTAHERLLLPRRINSVPEVFGGSTLSPTSHLQPAQPQPLRPVDVTNGGAPDADCVVGMAKQARMPPKSYAARLREITQAQQMGPHGPELAPPLG